MAVAGKADALALAAARKQIERRDGQQHARPLPGVEPLAVDEHRAEQRQHGACGVDRSHNRERQLLYGEVAAQPRGEHNAAFEHHKTVRRRRAAWDKVRTFRTHRAQCRTRNAGQEQGAADARVDAEHGDYGVAAQGVLLAHIVAAEQGGGKKGKGEPHSVLY